MHYIKSISVVRGPITQATFLNETATYLQCGWNQQKICRTVDEIDQLRTTRNSDARFRRRRRPTGAIPVYTSDAQRHDTLRHNCEYSNAYRMRASNVRLK